MSVLAVAHTEISERQHDTTGPLIAFSGSCNEITPVWVGLVKGKMANLKRYLPNLSTHFPEVKEWIQRCGLVGKCAKYTVWDVTLRWKMLAWVALSLGDSWQTIPNNKESKHLYYYLPHHTLSHCMHSLPLTNFCTVMTGLNLYPHSSIYIKHASFMLRHVS